MNLKGFATGGKDGKVILWDPEFNKRIKTYEITDKNVTADSRGKLSIISDEYFNDGLIFK